MKKLFKNKKLIIAISVVSLTTLVSAFKIIDETKSMGQAVPPKPQTTSVGEGRLLPGTVVNDPALLSALSAFKTESIASTVNTATNTLKMVEQGERLTKSISEGDFNPEVLRFIKSNAYNCGFNKLDIFKDYSFLFPNINLNKLCDSPDVMAKWKKDIDENFFPGNGSTEGEASKNRQKFLETTYKNAVALAMQNLASEEKEIEKLDAIREQVANSEEATQLELDKLRTAIAVEMLAEMKKQTKIMNMNMIGNIAK